MALGWIPTRAAGRCQPLPAIATTAAFMTTRRPGTTLTVSLAAASSSRSKIVRHVCALLKMLLDAEMHVVGERSRAVLLQTGLHLVTVEFVGLQGSAPEFSATSAITADKTSPVPTPITKGIQPEALEAIRRESNERNAPGGHICHSN